MKNAGWASLLPSPQNGLHDPNFSKPLSSWPAFLVLSLALMLTAMTTWQRWLAAEDTSRHGLALVADELAVKLKSRLAAQSMLLHSSAVLWTATSQPGPELWSGLVGALRAQNVFDSVLGIGFVQADNPAHSRVLFHEPLSATEGRLLGYDMQSDPALHQALERARDSNRTVVSGEVSLATGVPFEPMPVVLLVKPVYAGGQPVQTQAQRRVALTGWLYIPVRMNELLALLLDEDARGTDQALAQGQRAAAQGLIASIREIPSAEQGGSPFQKTAAHGPLVMDSLLQHQRVLDVDGRSWVLTVAKQQPDAGVDRSQVWISLAAGLALSLLLFGLILSMIRTQLRARQLARQFTRKLRRTERALRLSESRLRSTLDTLPYLLVELDLQGRYHDFHGPSDQLPSLARVLEDRQTVLDVLPPPAARVYLNALHEAMETGRAVGYQLSIDQAEGERWYELSVSRKPMSPGALPRFIVLSRDITEQRANQISLQRALAFQSSMLDASSHAVIATSRRGAITHYNRGAETMFGHMAADMVGEGAVQRLIAPSELLARAKALDLPITPAGGVSFEALATIAIGATVTLNEGQPQEWQAIRRDGSTFPALMMAMTLRGGDNGVADGFLFVIIDVSERARNRLALQAAMAAAEKANQAKSRFLAAASHDLRQPLAALQLYLGLMRGQMALSSPELMHNVDDCVSSLTELLDDLLDVSKLDAGVVTVERSDFLVDTLLRRQLSVHAAAANGKGLRLRFRQSNFICRTDPILLGRVVSNLVSNAIRYTQHGGVLMACRQREGRWWVEVRDTGIGIPPDQTQVIFEEFRQLDNQARNRGSGLGLAIVAKIAGLLGTEVRVRSTPGRGSLFAIELPAGRMLERSDMPPLLDQPTHRLRVALADDNIQILRALGLLMRGEGHTVVSGVNGNELMSGLADQAPDLVISDFRLGAGETGFDVIERVRERFGIDVPALIITGDTDPVMIRSMAAHDIEVQFKPLKPADLLALVSRVAARIQP